MPASTSNVLKQPPSKSSRKLPSKQTLPKSQMFEPDRDEVRAGYTINKVQIFLEKVDSFKEWLCFRCEKSRLLTVFRYPTEGNKMLQNVCQNTPPSNQNLQPMIYNLKKKTSFKTSRYQWILFLNTGQSLILSILGENNHHFCSKTKLN